MMRSARFATDADARDFGCSGCTSIFDEREPDFQMAERPSICSVKHAPAVERAALDGVILPVEIDASSMASADPEPPYDAGVILVA